MLAGGVIGIAAIFSDELFSFGGQTLTANIVTMSVFGAIVMYIMSMLSLFALRKKEPHLVRPFPAIGYPVFPAIALALAVVCLAAMIYYNTLLAGVFAGLMVLAYVLFMRGGQKRREAAAASMSAAS